MAATALHAHALQALALGVDLGSCPPACHWRVQREALHNNSFMVNGGKIGFPCQASKGLLLQYCWKDTADQHACPAWWQCMAA